MKYPKVGVGVILINKKSQILLGFRGPSARNENGLWDLIGGKVEFLETIKECAKRECNEEVGIDIHNVETIGVFDHLLPDEHWVSILLTAKVEGTNLQSCEPDKISEIAWFNLDDIPDNITISTKEAIKIYKNHILKHNCNRV